MFGAFEKNKQLLCISQYSVRQATIEQIFNMFAEDKVDESDFQHIGAGAEQTSSADTLSLNSAVAEQ